MSRELKRIQCLLPSNISSAIRADRAANDFTCPRAILWLPPRGAGLWKISQSNRTRRDHAINRVLPDLRAPENLMSR